MLAPKTYRVLEMAIDAGTAYGWRRAHKHVENPDEVAILDAINMAVMGEILEWFDIVEPEPSVECLV